MTIQPGEGPRAAEVQTGTPAPAPARTEKQSWLGRLFSRLMGTRRQAANAETAESVSRNPFSRLKSSGSRFNFRGSRQVPPRQSLPQMQSKNNEISITVDKASANKVSMDMGEVEGKLKGISSASQLIEKLRTDPEAVKALQVWGQKALHTENVNFLIAIIGMSKSESSQANMEDSLNALSSEARAVLEGKTKGGSGTLDKGSASAVVTIAKQLKTQDLNSLQGIHTQYTKKDAAQEINVPSGVAQLSEAGNEGKDVTKLSEGLAMSFCEIANMIAGNIKTYRWPSQK